MIYSPQVMAIKEEQVAKLKAEKEILLSTIADLQEEVDRLRRKVLALGELVAKEQTRAVDAVNQYNDAEAELQRLLSTRWYRLIKFCYYRLYESRYTGGVLKSTRLRVASWVNKVRGR
jgi:hypothetical protein